MQQLLQWFEDSLVDGTFVKLTLAGYRGEEPELRQLLLRPVLLQGERRVSCVWRYARRDVTKNLTGVAAVQMVSDSLRDEFRNANLFTTQRSVQWEQRGDHGHLHEGPPQHHQPMDLAHDRAKRRVFDSRKATWLVDLGVTYPEGRVRPGMGGKLRQIEKFVEILAARLPSDLLTARSTPLRIVDMACGKGYLTFAMAAWLRQQSCPAVIRGIEQRAELVENCTTIARAHGFNELQFEVHGIEDCALDHTDVLLALHACDTATDEALARGILANARILMASPCCHRELRSQVVPPAALAPALRHGIVLERQAELITDSLRAALLESVGYATDVFEFVATEHSAKNLLLVATRPVTGAVSGDPQAARSLAAHFGIRQQRLADRLGIELGSS